MHGSSVRSDVTIIFDTAFFAPAIVISPNSGLPPLMINFAMEEFFQLVDVHALLRARVAVAHRHGVLVRCPVIALPFAKRIEIHRDAERRADLVLRVIALADVAAVVPGDRKSFFWR